jgi:hypothetical protein
MMMFNSQKISELESKVEYLSKELMSANTEMALIKDRLSKIEKADAGNIRYKTLINLSVSGDTFKWWMAQKGEARQALFVDNVELRDALHDFTCWLAEYCDTKTVKVWGNGADFDNVILQHAYAKAGMEIPWHFWNNRCYRTTCDLLNAKQRKQEGVYHNALDDAKSQAKHLVQTLTARAVW